MKTKKHLKKNEIKTFKGFEVKKLNKIYGGDGRTYFILK